MNPSSIKKIINKKVTFIAPNDHLPTENRCSPISFHFFLVCELLLTYNKKLKI